MNGNNRIFKLINVAANFGQAIKCPACNIHDSLNLKTAGLKTVKSL